MCVLKAWQFLERNHGEQWVNVMLLEFNGFMYKAQKISVKNAGAWVLTVTAQEMRDRSIFSSKFPMHDNVHFQVLQDL